MDSRADQLWHLNCEYQKRLQQAKTYLTLLEQLTLSRGGDAQSLNMLHRVRVDIEILADEHRHWRYQYYYESVDTRRMVQAEREISHALMHFADMRARHDLALHRLERLLYQGQRPHPSVTRVPTGDLWAMTELAMHDLSGFDDYVRSLS
jgi:hypothetical protein